MKPAHIAKLLAAAHAKTQLDKARLDSIRAFQDQLRAEADAYALKARRSFLAEGADVAEGDLVLAARYAAFLEECEAGRRRAAALVEPQRMEGARALKQSLREEIAWRRLAAEAVAAQRKEKEDREEEKREQLSRVHRRRAIGGLR
ncbi:MAG: hypothetical protein AB7P23_01500 [Amphiplicatus sp.]